MLFWCAVQKHFSGVWGCVKPILGQIAANKNFAMESKINKLPHSICFEFFSDSFLTPPEIPLFRAVRRL